MKEKRQAKEDQTKQQSHTYSDTMIINFREIFIKTIWKLKWETTKLQEKKITKLPFNYP